MEYDYLLKHNDIDVALLLLNEDYRITKVEKILDKERLPNYIHIKNEYSNITFDDWLQYRFISPSRKGVKELLLKLDYKSPINLLMENYALSLTDHYWLCEKNQNIRWKDINYFENKFDENIGHFLIGDFNVLLNNNSTPEGASKGSLEKYWSVINKERFLIKGGAKPFFQEPVNEMICSAILHFLNIRHTEYFNKSIDKKIYSLCKNYLDTKNDEIPAWEVIGRFGNGVNSYESYQKCLEKLGLENEKKNVDQMIFIDFITGNTDRHNENFGLIRDAETLRYKDVIPIFDFGNSLNYNTDTAKVNYKEEINSVLFNKTHHENIKNIKSFDWLDFNKLQNVPDVISNKLNDKMYSILSSERKDMIAKLLKSRIKIFEHIINRSNSNKNGNIAKKQGRKI
ncbi:MAG: hypothetical protein FWF29_02625 [Treponema sp.]|nr:hypothetical protein [Treponema sp.]